MLIKKIDLAARAAEELKISGITTSASPDEIASFINRLDELMATLSHDGVDLGYLYPAEYGNSDPDDNSGLELWMVNPVAMLLASDIASSYGPDKAVAIDQRKVANAMESLSNGAVEVAGTKYPETLPVGSGNQYLETDDYFYRGDLPEGS